MYPPTPLTPPIPASPPLNPFSGPFYDFIPYDGDNDNDKMNHQLPQLKKIFQEHDDIKALQKVLDRAQPLTSTLYFLLDEIYDETPRMAEEMLKFKQYSPDELPGIVFDAFEREDYQFLEKLVALNIGDTLKTKIVNRALHMAVESHVTSGPHDSVLINHFDLIEALLDEGADPLNKTEYIGTNTESQNPLAIASNKTSPDKQLIQLLLDAAPESN